ncbi:SAM-dependent methyltransferase [Rhizobium sp. G21]|uniref:SAM-dependent methyltransferase n=1 Tax=Rhizobium sp. G21 TaxID=2758439 RepID=UPI001600FBA6|nr:SAM-dependent methyltransferase [Rhizobium sp. G21]MBB1249933.1 SAM-dependent methyltransferase [Rhizobium sp. G21]
MPVALNRDIRKTLNDVVRKARIAAEEGAQAALRQLGVADAKRPTWLSETDAALRVRLRAHARTLGDTLDTGDAARMPRLVREIAYAHWHRALFARFLLENGLLVDVDAGNAPVRPDELREIAEAEGRDVAEVAAEFAGPMLPEIFPKDDPVLALTLPPETRQRISDLVDGLSAQTFKADDSLGWTYQFWQEDRKKKVNESEVKIGADELPAVTQLFTEDYMVLFLLENTLGAWWAGKKLAENPDLARDATDEDELRRRLSLPGYAWTYLRFVREDDVWRPAAGAFPGWPQQASAITVLDPCMGSGHFLVFALDILVALRKAEEGLGDEVAVMAVLRDNLHGLEIDPRCTQIAAFALALAAWKRLGGVRPLPNLHLACSGLAIGMGKAEFVRLAEKIAEAEGFAGGPADLLGRERNPMEEMALSRRRGGLERLYDLFAQAPILGSLIDPLRALGVYGTLFSEGFEGLATTIGRVLSRVGDPEVREAAVTAQGLVKAAELLSKPFTLVATNVPYLGNGDFSSSLKTYIEAHHKRAKTDLAAVMIERNLLARSSATIAVVFPQNILFLPAYYRFRDFILSETAIDFVVTLGEEAWESFAKRGPLATLASLSLQKEESVHFVIDATKVSDIPSKRDLIQNSPLEAIRQEDQRSNPDSRILTSVLGTGSILDKYAVSLAGILNGDSDKFKRKTWEFPYVPTEWVFQQTAPSNETGCRGLTDLIYFDSENGHLREDETVRRDKLHNSDQRGNAAWGKMGVAVGQMRSLPRAPYYGEKFDSNVAIIVPRKEDDLEWISEFVFSDQFFERSRALESRKNITNATFGKVIVEKGEKLTFGRNRLPPRTPYSNDPSQWLFDGNPRGAADPKIHGRKGEPLRPGLAEHPLQVAVARLLGYRWPRQTGSSFMDCPAVVEPDEVEKAGIVDADGIVCLPPIHGEPAAHERVRDVLRVTWGPDWQDGVERACLEAEGWDKDLESWLVDGFFEGHCRLFHQTPFIWHIWDGVKGGFSALVNYHQLCAPNGDGRRLVEKLRDTYLGEWIGTQRRLVTSGDATAEDRLAAAEHLRDELTAIIEGKPPYDIFVRWKPLHEQPIGWEPDIDDGVRLNIRPFLTATTWRAKAKKACILRVMPGVKKHEGADRGGEPHRDKDDYPWFWAEDHDVATLDFAGGPEFKGRRYNDFHFTRPFKQAARDRKGSGRSPGSEAAE